MRRHFIIFALPGVLAWACSAHVLLADAVILKDGRRVEGEVKRTETGWTVTASDGKSTDVPADDVRTIEVGATKSNDATSASNLASLRRSAEALSNPALALERYRRFIEQNKGAPAVDDARRDMVIWQDRQDRGLVKVGTQWVTMAQKAEMAQQATSIAMQAVDFLKQERTTEAEPLIQQALDADPQNSAALYLRGVMLFGEQQIVAARKAFEAVAAAMANHAPTFNNLGVILWKQNQQMGAMRFYEDGMIASPVNKVLLDNIAEALAALPEDQRKNPLAVRVYKRFTEQDQQLQAIMAQTGWHRWGSTWVDQPTLDKLKVAEQQVKEKLDKIAADVAAAKSKISDIDASIDANTRSMNQLQADSLTRDSQGHVYQATVPPLYYTLQNDNDKLTADRAVQEAKIQSLAQDAKKVQQSMPVPQFTGVQRLIGAEGTPFPPTTAPSTSPATAPTSLPVTPPVLMPLP